VFQRAKERFDDKDVTVSSDMYPSHQILSSDQVFVSDSMSEHGIAGFIASQMT